MNDKLVDCKAMIVTALTAISSFLGWFGIVVCVYFVAMVLDFFTGSQKAIKKGDWNSGKARDGATRKFLSLVIVLVAGMTDIMIGLMLNNIPSIPLPFTYTAPFSLMVLIWYIITEFGSIIENIGEMGVPIPMFLKKSLSVFKASLTRAADVAMGEKAKEIGEYVEDEKKGQ